MKIIPFRAHHYRDLIDRANAKYITRAHAELFEEKNEFSFTGIIDGKVLICAGIFPYWEGRGEAWAIIDQNSRQHFIKFHNAVRRILNLSPLNRIEATVERNFTEGNRWMKLLGFNFEGVMRKYYPDGTDVNLFSRLREA